MDGGLEDAGDHKTRDRRGARGLFDQRCRRLSVPGPEDIGSLPAQTTFFLKSGTDRTCVQPVSQTNPSANRTDEQGK